MARLARVVIPDLPHHVTQRGNRGGRPVGADDWIKALEARTGRALAPPGTAPNHPHQPATNRAIYFIQCRRNPVIPCGRRSLMRAITLALIPAKAGTQVFIFQIPMAEARGSGSDSQKAWVPACAGMSGVECEA